MTALVVPMLPRARWAESSQLSRALGAAILTPPPGGVQVWDALDVPQPSGAEYTDAFVLSLPPHAAIHLSTEGKLGGEALDRVEGFWRALGLQPPADADHVGVLLLLLAELGAAASVCGDAARPRLEQAAAGLVHEHLWSWLPGYLDALRSLGHPTTSEWADVAQEMLGGLVTDLPPPADLPLALREAPPGLDTADGLASCLDGLVAPLVCGFVITHRDLRRCADAVGVGLRRGERRFMVRAVLEQDLAAFGWLAEHARSRAEVWTGDGRTESWWRARALRSAETLDRWSAVR